jgi:hypothetical protein
VDAEDLKTNKNTSNKVNVVPRTSPIDSKKLQIRFKNIIIGGQNQQGHSSG